MGVPAKSILFAVALTLWCSVIASGQDTESSDLYLVRVDNKIGFINRSGEVLIRTAFDDLVGDFSEGLAEFTDRNALPKYPFSKSGYIDTGGEIVIKPQFDVAYSFSDGLALVKVGDLHSFIDKAGKQVIKLGPYQAARSFREGLSAVHSNFEFWYINTDGRIVIPKQVGIPKDFAEGLACVYLLDEGKLRGGYIDKTGEVVIAPQFDDCFDFSEGLALVKVGEKYGFIDRSGKLVVDAKFHSASKFSNGRARVSSGDKYGFIDALGNLKVPEIYDVQTGDFSEGLAPVCKNDRCGYIDVNGKYVIEPRFRSAYEFKGGVARVQNPYYIEYIDKTGKYIWKRTN